MTVYSLSMQVECVAFFLKRFDSVDICRHTVDLHTVVVNKYYEISKSHIACVHQRFPYLSFLRLAVAEYAEYFVIFFVDFAGKRHTYRAAQALTKRACRHIAVRGKICPRLVEGLDFFHREVAFFSKYAIQSGTCVSFAHNYSVSVGIFWIFGVYFCNVVI